MDASSPAIEAALRSPPAARIVVGPETDFLAALKAHRGRDLAWIAAGIAEPPLWEERLRKAAYFSPAVAAAIPTCDIAPLFALVEDDTRAKHGAPDAARLDATAYVLGDRAAYEIPRLHAACGYLRADALSDALATLPPGLTTTQAVLDRLVDHWRLAGRVCVICDYLHVDTPRGLDVAESEDFESQAYLQHSPLGALRRGVADAIAHGLPPVSMPALDERPVQLHVMHFWGGGLETWVRDFGRADPTRINLILATFRIGETGGQRVVLYADPGSRVPVRVWDIARPIRSTVTASLEYRRILEEVIADFHVDALFVSSLIGHSFDALAQPAKTVIVCHDFYPVCPTINPFPPAVEAALRDRGGPDPLNALFNDRTPAEWAALRDAYVREVTARKLEMVVPSPSVAKTLRELAPPLAGVRMHVIPHGIDLAAPRVAPPARDPARRLRLAVMGRLSIHKGLELLREAAGALAAHADITLVGCGKNGVRLAEDCGWKAIETYDVGELPRLLAELAPDAGLLASVVPETFSYTLSELNALGIPAIATDHGAFADRIVDGETGFLFAPDKDSLVAKVAALRAQPAALDAVARRLAAAPQGRTTADMAADYRALVPLEPRAPARFAVGQGRQTALTEPYRQLDEAYARLQDAYAQVERAYRHTHGAYEASHGELARLQAILDAWSRNYTALEVRRHPWRVPQALELASGLAATLKNPKNPET